MLTANGLGSGLDINGLVTQLVASERIISDTQLNRESSRITSKFSALGSLKGAMGGFQSSLSGLTDASKFQSKKVSSSNADAISATVSSVAVPNSYSLEVSQLAESHALASIAFADADSTAVGTGSLTIRKGTTDYTLGTDTYTSFTENTDVDAITIDIDSSNNTLEGIAAAINNADAELNAAIINDGTGYRLLISSETTGADQSLEIVVADDLTTDTDLTGLSQLAFNSAATNLEQTNEGLNAQFTINGLSVSSSSNVVASAIDGVSLSLKQVTSGAVDIEVSADHSGVKTSVNSFIAGYNQFILTANALSSYNADTGVGGALLGDFTLRSVSQQVDSILRSSITGVTATAATLSELGITTTASGQLALNDVKFDAILQDEPDNVAKLFAELATPQDEEIVFSGATENTAVGTYAVDITQLATAGSYTSGAVLPNFGGGSTLTIDADNDNLTLEIDGFDIGEISLAHATYTTGDDLAAELQSKINLSDTLVAAGGSVTVSYDSGADSLTIQSASIGSFSTVNVLAVDTNTTTELGFSVGDGTAGVDVAGTIGGESASGTGNILVADTDTAADGLKITIEGGSTGARGDVVFTRGFASQLDTLLVQILDAEGALESRMDSFKGRLEEINERRESLELRWVALEERYRSQFGALDSLISNLNTTSAFLVNQLDNLNNLAQQQGNNN